MDTICLTLRFISNRESLKDQLVASLSNKVAQPVAQPDDFVFQRLLTMTGLNILEAYTILCNYKDDIKLLDGIVP